MLLKDYIPNLNKSYGNIFFSGVSFESTKVKKNNIFFAIEGNKFDGNNYIHEAIKTRRTIHNFETQEVPMEKIIRAINSANHAPCHRLSFPWRFTSAGKPQRDILADLLVSIKSGEKLFDDKISNVFYKKRNDKNQSNRKVIQKLVNDGKFDLLCEEMTSRIKPV